MKKNVLFLIVAMAVCMNLMAQRRNEPPMGERQVERMKKELALTDEQVKKLEDLNKKFRESQIALRADSSLTRDEKISQSRALMTTREEDIKKILTKEQNDKWAAMKTGGARQVSQRQRPDPMEELKTELKLSDEQAEKISSINAVMFQQFRELRSDTTLTQDGRLKAQRRIMEDRTASIKKVLSKEQYEKFVAFEKERMKDRRRMGRGPQPKRQ